MQHLLTRSKDLQKNGDIERLKNVIVLKDNNIQSLQTSIQSLQTEIGKLNQFKIDNEKMKSQITHLDTFKNNLVDAQKTIKQKEKAIEDAVQEKNDIIAQLNEQIEYLKLTPAKRKKLEAKKQGVEEEIEPETEEVETKVVALPEIKQPQEKVTLESLMEEPTKKDGGSF